MTTYPEFTLVAIQAAAVLFGREPGIDDRTAMSELIFPSQKFAGFELNLAFNSS